MPLITDLFWTYQTFITQLAINGLLALSVYCVLATGQMFLGQIGFMAVGAYISAYLTVTYGWPAWLSMLAGVALCVLVALLMVRPMLRLSGVYMAIGTIAFGEVVRSIVINFDEFGGALGMAGIPQSLSLGNLYLLVVVLAALLVCAIHSRLGRDVEAVRCDEVAASSMGVRVRRIKLVSVLVSAALAGLAGAASAHSLGTVSPDDFSFVATVGALSFAVLGGIASPLGTLAGALVLTTLPELLSSVSQFRTMISGLAIVIVVIALPAGLFPFKVIRVRGNVKRK